MPASYSSIRIHVVFSTKDRRPWLTPEIRERLWQYLSKTGEALEYKVLAVGGEVDHVHLLIVVPSKIAASVAIQKLKANASRWIRNTFGLKLFSWQDGYGAFSVSITNTAAVVAYIDSQAEHHRKRDFRAEFEQILRMHGVKAESLPSYGL
jgi:putative transposase